MKLVCHIGTPKTGSTFLQNTVAENRDWFGCNGVIYPDLMAPGANHITLFYAVANYIHDFAREYGLKTREDVLAFRERMGARIAKQVEQAPEDAHTMLMSSENLTGNLHGRAGIQNLHDMLRPCFEEIKIIIYLRRQDDAILSMWGEHMRKGYSGMDFPEFTDTCLCKDSNIIPYIRYRRILSLWADVFGREALDVRLFDRDRFAGGDILSDFLTALFGRDLPDLSELRPAAADNTGLAAPVLEFLHRMYPHIPRRRNGALNPVRERLSARIDALPATPRPRMAPEQSQRIMDHFRPANTWLRETFFPDCEGAVFPDRESGEDSNMGQITIAQFAEYAGRLFT